MVAAEHVAHAPRLELEHAGSKTPVEDLPVGLLVVEGNLLERERDPASLLDELESVVKDGERGQAEEVHLEEAKLFDRPPCRRP